jgi:hypothetical protein
MKRVIGIVGITVMMMFGVTAASASEVVTLTPGDDVYHHHGGGSEIIHALAGNDRVFGGKAHDEVYGQRGRDRIHNRTAGSGLLNGGPGRDTCWVGVRPGGGTNVTVVSCETIHYVEVAP